MSTTAGGLAASSQLSTPESIARGYGPTCARKIRQETKEAKAPFSADQQAKADKLIASGSITLRERGLYVAVSSKGDTTYCVTEHSCSCPAGVHDRRCYHLLAVRLLEIRTRLPRRVRPLAVPAPAPAPEAEPDDIWAELEALGAIGAGAL